MFTNVLVRSILRAVAADYSVINEVLLSLIRLTCIYHDVIEHIRYEDIFTAKVVIVVILCFIYRNVLAY